MIDVKFLTYDFYTKVLGLRLVKKSVNQDQVEAYHLFFGDKTGEPGMDLTFFTFSPIIQGHRGLGSVTSIGLTVKESSLDFWQKRFEEHQVKFEALHDRFSIPRLVFYDRDNQRLELVGVSETEYQAALTEIWPNSPVTNQHAIASFYSAKLTVDSLDSVKPILEQALDYQPDKTEGLLTQFQNPKSQRGAYLEVEVHPTSDFVSNGAGTVHHIAFRVKDEAELLQTRKSLTQLGLRPTGIIDRYYFKSVYFRTPAGILFELATDGPGFTVDEAESTLGQALALPPFLEPYRSRIEAQLPPIDIT